MERLQKVRSNSHYLKEKLEVQIDVGFLLSLIAPSAHIKNVFCNNLHVINSKIACLKNTEVSNFLLCSPAVQNDFILLYLTMGTSLYYFNVLSHRMTVLCPVVRMNVVFTYEQHKNTSSRQKHTCACTYIHTYI